MTDPDCVFCKIASGQWNCARIWEDDRFLAFLDIYPNVRGMTLVVTKEHYPSYAFNLSDDVYADFLAAAKEVALLLDRALRVHRTAMVMEGMGINHAHIKLYPLHGLSGEFAEMWGDERIYFEKYEGYVSTLLGPPADTNELERLAAKIRNASPG